MIEPTKSAAKAVVLAVLITDLFSSTMRAYACVSKNPQPPELHCLPAGEIIPSLGLKLAMLINSMGGGLPQPVRHGVAVPVAPAH